MRIIFLSLFALSFTFSEGQEIAENTPFLSIRGRASSYVPADHLNLSAGVLTHGATAMEALQENNDKMEKVISSLQQAGLKESDYKTGRFSVQPLYKQQPHPLPANWRQEIIGFEVNNNLSIQTEKIHEAGNIIDALAQAGANSIDNIQFTLNNQRPHYEEALARAVINARSEAQVLSKTAQVQLGRVLKIVAGEEGPLPRGVYLAKSFAAERVPIVSGDIEISAEVSIVYELLPPNGGSLSAIEN